MSALTVAIIQTCSGPFIEDNIQQIEKLIDQELKEPPSLLLFPECFASMEGDLTEVEKNSLYLRHWMQKQAQTHQCWLVGGSIPYRDYEKEKPRGSCFVYDPQGHEVARYDKIHLFDVDVSDNTGCYRESDDYLAGNQLVTVPMSDFSPACLGLSICYDLRFPELYRELVSDGATIFCVPSAFTHITGQAHWESLLKARAIENQSFVLAANQGGRHPKGKETWGHSMIISPWGDILAEANSNTPTIVSARLDLILIEKFRSKMPCLKHKKL
ncbi:MAG: carbon-nitrogen hydrolase family protein [Endozoicomonas sp. (ex Botrylloides leachii)]|nr:carbon-nitrogen hydrolase family protein [Endozoicomonas sp. (ex Botrylloides leachii)]